MEARHATNKSPDEVAEFIGQFWIDYSARRAWIAIGISAISDWLELNTAEQTRIFNQTTSTSQPVQLAGTEAEAGFVIGPST
jgi:hypothetical protein